MKTPRPDRSPPLEIELKLALPAGQHAAFIDYMTRGRRPPLRQTLLTRYFDTPDFALAAQGIALRVRRIGRRRVQTLKTEGMRQGGLSQRIEHEMPVAGDHPDWSRFPPETRDWVPAALRKRLRPVFETQFVRTVWRVVDADGTEIEVALDSGEIRAGARRAAISEIELELIAGPPDVLFEWALDCARAFDCLPLDPSKAERGARLARDRPQQAATATRPVLASTTTVAAGCVAIVEACLGQFQANLPGVLEGRDSEYLHQARVALRRLRVALRLFRRVCAPPQPLLDALKALDAALGPARDHDVLCEEILPAMAPHVDDAAAWQAWLAHVEAQRAAVRAALAEALDALRPGAWLLDFNRWARHYAAERHGEAPRRTRLKPWARRRLERQRQRLIARAHDARTADPVTVHAFRIEVKRHRYALEFFEALFDADALAPCVAALQGLQTRLGRANDRRQARRLVAAMPDDGSGMRAFVLGWLAALDAGDAGEPLARQIKRLIRSTPCL